jgi:hypothetical protein
VGQVEAVAVEEEAVGKIEKTSSKNAGFFVLLFLAF